MGLGSDLMKLTFENNINDVMALNKYLCEKSRHNRKYNMFIRFAGPIIVILSIIAFFIVYDKPFESSVARGAIIRLSIIGVLWFFLIIPFQNSIIKKKAKKLYLNSKTHDMIIETDNNNLILSDSSATATIKVSCLNKVVIIENYFFIFTDITNAIVIPQTILEEQGSKDELIKFFNDNKCLIEYY